MSIAAVRAGTVDLGLSQSMILPQISMNSVPPSYVFSRTKAHETGGSCVVFRPQGNKIGTAGNEGIVKLWTLNLNSEYKSVKVSNGPVSCLNFNTTGELMAAGDNASQIALIKIKPDLQIVEKLQGHKDIVNHCVFASEESKRLVSISQDHTMRIWDISRKTELKTSGFTSSCWALDIAKNDTRFATGHKTGEIKIWSL